MVQAGGDDDVFQVKTQEEKGQEETEDQDEGSLLLGHTGRWHLENDGINKIY